MHRGSLPPRQAGLQMTTCVDRRAAVALRSEHRSNVAQARPSRYSGWTQTPDHAWSSWAPVTAADLDSL